MFQVLSLEPSVFSITYCFMCILVKSNYPWFGKIQCFLANDQEGKHLIYTEGLFSGLPQRNIFKRPEKNSGERKQQEDPVFLCRSAGLVANTNITTFQSPIFHILKWLAEIPPSESICHQLGLFCLWLNFLFHGTSAKWWRFNFLRINQKWWWLTRRQWFSNFNLHPNCLECLRFRFPSIIIELPQCPRCSLRICISGDFPGKLMAAILGSMFWEPLWWRLWLLGPLVKNYPLTAGSQI